MVVKSKLFINVFGVLGDEEFCQVSYINDGFGGQDYFVYVFNMFKCDVVFQFENFLCYDYQGLYYGKIGEDCVCNKVGWEDCGMLVWNYGSGEVKGYDGVY